MKKLAAIIKLMRPRQWLKSLSVLGAPALMWRLFEPQVIPNALYAFLAFSIVSSGAYVMNDLIDRKKDAFHPKKKNRPIASGQVKPIEALIMLVCLFSGGIFLSYKLIGELFALVVIAFCLLQFFYSVKLKNIIIIDTFTVATLFVIRVLAGGLATQTSISSWLFLTTISLSLLLAFGKRQSEKTLLEPYKKDNIEEFKTRSTLKLYSEGLLNRMITVSATLSCISYSLVAFFASPDIRLDFMPAIFKEIKVFMVTIPMIIYGVGRYVFVIYEKQDAESPDKVLLTDKHLILNIVIWGTTIIVINYLSTA